MMKLADIAAMTFVLTLLPQIASAHGIYTGLTNSRGQLCCGDNDCGPVYPQDFRRDKDGNMWIRRTGTYSRGPNGDDWFPLDMANVLPVPSPDAHIHACVWGGEVKCILLPNGD